MYFYETQESRKNGNLIKGRLPLKSFGFFFFLFSREGFGTPVAYGSSQARDRIQAAVTTYAICMATLDP